MLPEDADVASVLPAAERNGLATGTDSFQPFSSDTAREVRLADAH